MGARRFTLWQVIVCAPMPADVRARMDRLFERNRTHVFSESIEHVVSRKPYFNRKVKAWLPCSVVSEVTASLMASD